jgi:hypothetical protein
VLDNQIASRRIEPSVTAAAGHDAAVDAGILVQIDREFDRPLLTQSQRFRRIILPEDAQVHSRRKSSRGAGGENQRER